MSTGFVADEMTIRGQTIPTRTGNVNVSALKFYADNPRVYSVVHSNGGSPTQEEIEEQLLDLDHVRMLIQDIRSHGGLIEPLIVRDGTMDVLEGNSRLAAYRFLNRQDPLKWSRVKCCILPENISPSIISALLSQLHLKGKHEWPAYEQGGHLFRRHTRDKVSLEELKVETGLTKAHLAKTIEAYQLMVRYKDEKRDRWSYYLEFVKSAQIGRIRKDHADFDQQIVKKIRNGEIETAQDLRDMLPVICKSGIKTVRKFLDDKLDFQEAYDEARAGGADNRYLNRLKQFRSFLADPEVQDDLGGAEGKLRAQIQYEIKSIVKLVSGVEKKFAR